MNQENHRFMPRAASGSRAGTGRRPGIRFRTRTRSRWMRYTAYGAAVLVLVVGALLTYDYIAFSRMIDARLHGERERTLPRVFARPVEIRRGQTITQPELVGRLNDLGYTQRARVEHPGEFAIGRNAVALTPRSGDLKGSTVRVVFNAPTPPPRGRPASPRPASGVNTIEVLGRGKTVRAETAQLDPPLLTALMTTGREKRRRVPLAGIQPRVRQAVLAIE